MSPHRKYIAHRPLLILFAVLLTSPLIGQSLQKAHESTVESTCAGSGILATPRQRALCHVVPFTRIDDSIPRADLTDPDARAEYEYARSAIMVMARRMHIYGLQWTLQPDWKFLLAALTFEKELISSETDGRNMFVFLKEEYGVRFDPYSRERLGYNYCDVAYLLDSLGVGGSTVVGGHFWDPASPVYQLWELFRMPLFGLTYREASWQAGILTGSSTWDHTGEPIVSGVWRPADRWHYFDDDSTANLLGIGQYTNDLPGIRELVALHRRGAVHPDSMLTSGCHIRWDAVLDPIGQGAIEDTVLRALAEMRDAGEIQVTDFTTLAEKWREYYHAKPCVYRPGISTLDAARPPAAEAFTLLPVYPNPAAATATIRLATIRLATPHAAAFQLSIHDAIGREVGAFIFNPAASGCHEYRFDVAGWANGIYIARIRSGISVRVVRFLVAH
jgi:hypothetical protein